MVLWSMKYLILTRKKLSNYVEGRALRSNSMEVMYRFILEDIIYRYESIERMRANLGELNIIEACDFFT